MIVNKKITIFIILFLSYTLIKAENKSDSKVEEDSLRIYHLGSVVNITDKANKLNIPSAITNINHSDIRKTDASSFNEMAIVMPSTFFQTNSRGESSLFIRGVGERRTEIFFDGVLLNVPWDRHYDLKMIPTDIMGSMNISNGAASILYGSNTMGGAVEISTLERNQQGWGATAEIIGGMGGILDFSLTHDRRLENFNYIANIGFYKRDGLVLDKESYELAQDNAPEMLQQDKGTSLRTNSDESLFNVYLRGEYHFQKETSLGVSFFHTNSEKGVVPLGYEEDPRLWRYPMYRRSIAAMNFKSKISEKQRYTATLWFDKFDQSIDSYTDLTYSSKKNNLYDDVSTVSSRLAYFYDISNKHTLTATANAYYINNTETTADYNDNHGLEAGESLDYAEVLYDLGLEYKLKPIEKLILSVGGLFSGQINPKTGQYTDQEGKTSNDFGAVFGFKYLLSNPTSIFANISRKVSYPSLREVYANDPQKFDPNPDLTPEHGILSEVGLDIDKSKWTIQLAGFYNIYDDMLAKTQLDNGKKMRVNLAQAFIGGVELVFDVDLIKKLDVKGTFTYMYGRGRDSKNDDWNYLEYVPEVIANLVVQYEFPKQIKTNLEFDYIGQQYEVTSLSYLDPSFLMNARVSYLLPFDNSGIEVFARCNNLLDQLRIPQLGLPAPGRTVLLGIKANL